MGVLVFLPSGSSTSGLVVETSSDCVTSPQSGLLAGGIIKVFATSQEAEQSPACLLAGGKDLCH